MVLQTQAEATRADRGWTTRQPGAMHYRAYRAVCHPRMVAHRRYTLMRMRWHLSVQTAALHVRLHRVHLFLPVPVQFAALFWYCSTSRKSTGHAEKKKCQSMTTGGWPVAQATTITTGYFLKRFHLRARSDDMKVDPRRIIRVTGNNHY